MLVIGMVFMFDWNPAFHHESSWATPGDQWGMLRGAHFVAWGYLGGVYSQGNGIVTLPGMPILLAPVAILSSHFHLSESYQPFMLSRPTAALLLEPAEILAASTVVFACDALTERLDLSRRRRFAVCIVVAVVAWPTAAIWGHAEDAMAVTFAIYALLALMDSRWSAVAWLLGFGIVMQPLVAMLVPLLAAAAPRGARLSVVVRAALLPVFLVATALAGNLGDTYRALLTQPTPPSVNHATPWVAWTPKLHSGIVSVGHTVRLIPGSGHPVLGPISPSTQAAASVAAGPGRLLYLLLALIIALWVMVRPQPIDRLLWLAAAVLASRCLFEAVMTPYYLAPPLILSIVLSARMGARRFWAVVAISLEVTVFAYHHLEPWAWWLPILVALVGVLALNFPAGMPSPSGTQAPGSTVIPRPAADLEVSSSWRPTMPSDEMTSDEQRSFAQ